MDTQQAPMGVGEAISKAWEQHTVPVETPQQQTSANPAAQPAQEQSQTTESKQAASAPGQSGPERKMVPVQSYLSEKQHRQQLQVEQAKLAKTNADLLARIEALSKGTQTKPQTAEERWLAETVGDTDEPELHPKVKAAIEELEKLKKDYGDLSTEYRTTQQIAREEQEDGQYSSLLEQVHTELPGMDKGYVEEVVAALIRAEPDGSTRSLSQILAPLAKQWKRYHGQPAAQNPATQASRPAGTQAKAPPQIGAASTAQPQVAQKVDFGNLGKYMAQRLAGQ